MIEDKLCAHCGKPFLPFKVWQKYCSRICNNAAYYERKARKTGVDVLDIPEGPSEAQVADRERRMTLREKQDATPRNQEVVERAEEYLATPKPTLSNLGYAPTSTEVQEALKKAKEVRKPNEAKTMEEFDKELDEGTQS